MGVLELAACVNIIAVASTAQQRFVGRGRRAGSSPSALFCGTQTPGRFVRQLKMDFFAGGGASSSVSAALMAGCCAVWECCLIRLLAVLPGWRRFVRTCRSRWFVIRERFTRPPGCPKRYASCKSLQARTTTAWGRHGTGYFPSQMPPVVALGPVSRPRRELWECRSSRARREHRDSSTTTPSTRMKTTTQPSYPASSHASRDQSPGGSHASTGLCIDSDSRS